MMKIDDCLMLFLLIEISVTLIWMLFREIKCSTTHAHLRFSVSWAAYNNVKQEHPQQVMKELGITYQHATPQSMGGQWWFWNCENIPGDLPPYLEAADRNPMKCIGYGLNEKTAKAIRDYSNNKE